MLHLALCLSLLVDPILWGGGGWFEIIAFTHVVFKPVTMPLFS